MAGEEISSGSPGPVVTPLRTVHDAGQVPLGATINAEFSLRNDGGEPVRITAVRPGCDCTLVDYDPEIAAGKEGTFRVAVDTSDLLGPIVKSVAVFTNDPGRPHVELVVRAEVQPFVAVHPGRARHLFGRRTIAQSVWATDGRSFEILAVSSTTPRIETSFRRARPEERDPSGPQEQWRIETTLIEGTSPGAFSGRVVIDTNHPRQPRAEFIVTGVARRAQGRSSSSP